MSLIGRLLDQRRVVFGCGPCIVMFNFFDYACLLFIQKSFDSTLSISSFLSHLCNWCVWYVVIVKLYFFVIFEDVLFKVLVGAFL